MARRCASVEILSASPCHGFHSMRAECMPQLVPVTCACSGDDGSTSATFRATLELGIAGPAAAAAWPVALLPLTSSASPSTVSATGTRVAYAFAYTA